MSRYTEYFVHIRCTTGQLADARPKPSVALYPLCGFHTWTAQQRGAVDLALVYPQFAHKHTGLGFQLVPPSLQFGCHTGMQLRTPFIVPVIRSLFDKMRLARRNLN